MGGAVVLLQVPARLFLESHHHLSGLFQELQVVRSGSESGLADPGMRLGGLLRELVAGYAPVKDSAYAQALDAHQAGQSEVDIRFDLPTGAGADFPRLVELLDDADRLSRRGLLLTLPAESDVVALRRWVADEIRRQSDGEDPQPCPVVPSRSRASAI